MSDLIPDLQTYKEAMAAWQSAPAGSRPTPTLAAIQAAFPAYRFKILRNGSNGWRNGTLLVDLVMAGLMPVAANQILITQGQIQSVATITEINWADGSTYTAVLISGDGKRTIRGSIGTGGTQFVASGNLVAANGLGSMAVVVTLPQVTAPPPAPAPTPTPTPTALSVSAALRDMVARNSNDWGPALNPVWGFNSEGDPATGSYAYIDTGIRAADVGPTGAIGPHYPANATLDNTGFVGVGETVQKFPWWVLDDAFQKRNVPGTGSLVRALRDYWQEAKKGGKDFPIYFITASPPQLESKIHDKLAYDGIYPFGIFCKDNLQNVRPGRLWRLTQQVGYKLQSLLQLRLHLADDVRQILWGDDSEADAVIYSLYSDLCARRLEERDARQILKHFKAHLRIPPTPNEATP
jgi:hypothetical protein